MTSDSRATPPTDPMTTPRLTSAADMIARENRRHGLAGGTHIPTLNFRWYIDFDGERTLQQQCTTTGGETFWKDVPEFNSDEGEHGDG